VAITKVWIEDGCITCGSSEATCPEVFKIDISRGTTIVLPDVDFTLFESKIRQAAAACPVKVIKIEES
jgi:ferredoxin